MLKTALKLVLYYCILAAAIGGCAGKDVVKPDVPALATEKTTWKDAPPAQSVEIASATNITQTATVVTNVTDTTSSDVHLSPSPLTGSSHLSPFETVYFDFDDHSLRNNARVSISKNAETIGKLDGVIIHIDGHCDERGSTEYNLALGERRAASVKKYLVALGINGDRLLTVSFGKEKPAVSGSNEAAWLKNRRVEFTVK